MVFLVLGDRGSIDQPTNRGLGVVYSSRHHHLLAGTRSLHLCSSWPMTITLLVPHPPTQPTGFFAFLFFVFWFSLGCQAAYHGVRDSYQFTAELRKVLHSLPPRAARAACEALRDPAGAAGAAAVSRSSSSTRDGRGKKRRRWDDAPPCTGQGVASSAAAAAAGGGGGAGSDDDELPYTTQVGVLF